MEASDRIRGPSSKKKCSPARVKSCLRTFLAHLFSHIGLCVLIVGYTVAGAALFEHLESKNELSERQGRSKNWTRRFSQVRLQYIGELWNITEKFNVLYELNWTNAVDKELRNFEEVVASAAKREGYEVGWEVDRKWSFSGALLYSVSIITTIGYGHVAPKTMIGKMFTMVYALIGIPLMLLWLSNIGTLMANTFKFVYLHLCCVHRQPVQKSSSSSNSQISKHLPSQIKYSKGGKCETVLLSEPNHITSAQIPTSSNCVQNSVKGPRGSPSMRFSNHTPTLTKFRGSPGLLRELDPDARSVLYECAQYNMEMCGGDDEKSRRVLNQLRTPYVIDEEEEENIDEEDDPYLGSQPQCTCGVAEAMANARGVGMGTMGREVSSFQGTPSKIPLLGNPEYGMGPDLVELDSEEFDERLKRRRGSESGGDNESGEGEVKVDDRVPVTLVLSFLVFYIMVGAFVFSIWEEWNILESAYFVFTTLSTIGLGDYVPGRSLGSAESEEGQAQLLVCCLYLVLGLAIIAMSFNLVQEEVTAKVKVIARNVGIIKEDTPG